MTKLSVNINKVATIRNARGGNNPDLIKVAMDCESFGAEGITVHPRPDERHIRYSDVRNLKPILTTEFNIEGNPNDDFIRLVEEIKPAQITLVPDAHNVLTSNAGWNTIKHKEFLTSVVERLKLVSRVSIFVDPEEEMVAGAKACGADRVELYTESYAKNYFIDRDKAIEPFIKAANEAKHQNLGLNAGHDLDLDNLEFFHKNIPNLLEVSIGHALICDALYYGLQNTIQMYKRCLQ
ncbi:MAG TPA: pyridoxine 5'-phosphate synthase [Bacteroidales bacterium]|nr:pyridoxine 5'-phosphate synthase [Bacteroidales bacterium]